MKTGKKRLPLVCWILGALLFVALFRDVLANGRPLYCRIGGTAYFPGLRTIFISKDIPYAQPALRKIQLQESSFEAWKAASNYDETPVFAPIPFSPGEYSRKIEQSFAVPSARDANLDEGFRHWLGTDHDGRDVAAGMVAGTRIAVLVGFLSMLIGGALGLILGSLAGFWGDNRLRVSPWALLVVLSGVPVAYFYAIPARYYALDTAETTNEWWVSMVIFTGILLGFIFLGRAVSRIFKGTSKIAVPVDLIVMRLTEIYTAVPKLILILVLAAVLPKNQSIWVMIVLIGLLSWTDVAVFIRAELLRVRALDYITAGRSMGLSELRLFWKHALPNSLRPAVVIFTFGIAGAILLESALTFIGFGGDTLNGISWGSLMHNVRVKPQAWWVTIPPGLAIALTILTINKIGELISERKI